MWLVLTPGPHVRENTPSYLCCREGTGLHVPRCRRCCSVPLAAAWGRLWPSCVYPGQHGDLTHTTAACGSTKAAAGPHSDVVASRVQRESPFGVTPVPVGTLSSWAQSEPQPLLRDMQHPGRLAPLGGMQAVSPVVGLRDASSGDKPHIWARSRLLEAGTRQAADNPADSGSHRTSPSPLAPASRGCLYLPLPILGCRLCMWGTMVPARVLGLLLCVHVCMGESWGRAVAMGKG